MELGISLQPLQESYALYSKWITITLLKSIWEQVDIIQVTIENAPLPINPPQDREKWFVQATIEADVTNPNEQSILNHFLYHH
jgi:hypothetical protein